MESPDRGVPVTQIPFHRPAEGAALVQGSEADAASPDDADEAIVARVRAGATEQFPLLMRRYDQRVYRTARAILRDDREAEEVAQDAWVRAFVHLGSFEGRSRFSTWLTRIAVNEALRRGRSQRFAARAADGFEHVSGGVPASAGSAEQNALRGEMRAALEHAIEALPDAFRATFVLRDVEGLSTAEAAECLEIAEETVKTRLHRARALLRRDLERRFGSGLRESFSFGAERCDRTVARVLERIRRVVAAGKAAGGAMGDPAADAAGGARGAEAAEGAEGAGGAQGD